VENNIKIEEIKVMVAVDRGVFDSALDLVLDAIRKDSDLQLLDYENPIEYDVKRTEVFN
jgi:hypothetical protein